MTVKLGSNFIANQASLKANKASNELSKVMERLSSGLRITKVGDDPAGFALANHAELNSKVFRQGVRNLNDTISLLNVADVGAQQLISIVDRISELATQAANSLYSSSQRQALDEEAQALKEEYNRILASTSYNKSYLLDGTFGTRTAQAGFGTDGAIEYGIEFQSETVEGLGTYGTNLLLGNSIIYVGKSLASDINNDGHMDLFYSGSGSADESIMLGNGNGTFKAVITITGPYTTNNRDAELQDINGDGNLDFLTINIDGSLMVMTGAGTGSFTADASYSASGASLTLSLALGDFDEDGNLDVVTTSPATDELFILMGNSNGTFNAAITYSAGNSSNALGSEVDVGDFNNDGNLDIVSTATVDGGVDIFLGTGTGTFAARVSTVTHGFGAVSSISVGDFNNDGMDDVVDTNGVYLSTGAGALSLSYAFDIVNTQDHQVYDLNNDGNLDIVTAGIINRVHFGNGNGTFTVGQTFSPGTVMTNGQVIISDFNEDNFGDIGFMMNSVGERIYFQDTAVSEGINLGNFNLLTSEAAEYAITYLDDIKSALETGQGEISAHLSRIEIAASNLSSAAVNFSEAAARITSIDVAEETAQMVKYKILQKAATAVVAQANQNAKNVLRLLG